MSIRYLNGKISRIERFCCYEYIYMTKKNQLENVLFDFELSKMNISY